VAEYSHIHREFGQNGPESPGVQAITTGNCVQGFCSGKIPGLLDTQPWTALSKHSSTKSTPTSVQTVATCDEACCML
jgi:hypothetical protein